MYYQKGSTLQLDEEGRAESGILIRHLVLPGHSDDSLKVLRSIADELSPGIHLSLMSQYHPTLMSEVTGILTEPFTMQNMKLLSGRWRSLVSGTAGSRIWKAT